MAAMWSKVASRRPWLIPLAGLALLSAAFWADCLVGPYAPLAAGSQAKMEPWRSELDLPDRDVPWYPLLWDGVGQFYPWRVLAARELRAGRLALWNPHQFCGYPLVGNGQSALFYPPNWLLAVVDVRWGMGLLAALHSFLAAALTWLFARRVGIGPVAAAFGGIAFAWGGFMVGWAELPTLVNVAAWLPGALLGIALVFERSRWGVPVLAAALGLTLLAGHFQIAIYLWLAALAYAGLRALWEAVNHRTWYPLSLAAGFGLALLVGAPQALPSLELVGNSPRGAGAPTEGGFEFHRARALQPEELLALLRPNAFGTPARGDHVLTRYGIPYAEHCGFVGISTLLLALIGIGLARTRHFALFLIAGAAALNVAMCGPLAQAMYFGIPKLGLAGSFTRALCIYTFAMALAGAAGLDALLRRLRSRGPAWGARTLRPAAVLGAIALLVLGYELLPWAHEYLPRTRREQVYAITPTIERLMQAPGRVLAVTPRRKWGLVRTPPALLPPNSATVYGYDSVSGYDSLYPRDYRRFAFKAEQREPSPGVNGNMLLLENADSPLYAAAGLTTVATMPYGEVGRGVDVDVLDGALPRAFVAPDGHEWALPILQALLPEAEPLAPEDIGPVQPAQMRRVSPCVIAISRMDTAGWAPRLVVSETFYPGWRAYVDGEERSVVAAAHIFCAVPLGPHDREVHLVFEPLSVRLGLFLGLAGLGALAGLIVFRRESIPWT